jgi:beta-glucosidase
MTLKRHPLFLAVVILAGLPAAAITQVRTFSDRTAVAHAVDSILNQLTLDEKIGQLVQYTGGWDTGPAGRTISKDQQSLVREGKVGSIFNVTGAVVTRELQRIAVTESRAKIPLLFGLDVIHGFKTTFPIPLAEASTWNPDAVERSTRVAATEASSSGIAWTFAPMVDIARDPRWGRIAEGSGEDPYLGSVMATARVHGFQGADLADPSSIVACAKHYAAYGAAEGGRDYNTVEVTDRTLRDVYLRPFKAAVDAGVGTLMASFNEIGGVPSSGNHYLLTDILRHEWKFDGFVVSDWNSIGELIPHGFATGPKQAAERAINAGLDMDMMSGCYQDHLAELVKEGKVSIKTIDESVRRILTVKLRLGLFADPYRGTSPAREKASLVTPANLKVAREVAGESIILLRNEHGLLPLSSAGKTIAVIGPLANDHSDPLGPWAGPADTNTVVTLLEGIRGAAADATILTAWGCGIAGDDTSGFASAVSVARQADVVLLAVGESRDMSGEASSRSCIGLPGRQQELVKAVVATGTPVVLVLMNGRPLTIPWEADHVPAILETWFLGAETGNAIADVVFGAIAPSGRLPVSVPRAVGQIPIYYDHKNTGRPPDPTNHFTSKYLDLPSTPLYPFGYGLSYTTFSYSDLKVATPVLGIRDTLRVSAVVSNSGSRDADEVVQLYVRDMFASVTRPVKELKGFRKIRIISGSATTVSFLLPVQDLSFTRLDGTRGVEPGSFKVWIGANAAEGLEGSFEVRGE